MSNVIGTSTEGNVNVKANPVTGALLVEGVAGGLGSSDTTEATQLLVKTAVESINTKTGEVQASPTANTVLGRLKDLLTGIVLAAGTAIIGKVGIDQTTPGTTDSVTIKASVGIGSLTETAPATDTASSGLNGRLQRLAVHLTNVVSYTSRLLSSAGPKAAGTALATTAFQVGGTYNATPPTVADTQEVGLQVDVNGRLNTSANLPYTIAGEDIANDVLKIEERKSFVNITTQTTTVVKSGAGHLKRIVFGQPLAAGVVTIYDNTAASGTLISTITFPATLLNDVTTIDFDCAFATGLTIVTSGATQDITVIYR